MMEQSSASVTTNQPPSSSPYYEFHDAGHVKHTPSTSFTTYGYQPQIGTWRDGLFDFMSNLWPSCCCVCMGGYGAGCLSMFLAGQISSRLGWFDTLTVVVTYSIFVTFFWFIGFIIVAAVPPQNGSAASILLFWFPYFIAFLFLMFLRVKFVERFQIREEPIETLCVGFWCSPCSLCQMARHMYGYTKQFDGDGLLDGSMNYQLLPTSASTLGSDSFKTYIPPSTSSGAIVTSNHSSHSLYGAANANASAGAPTSPNPNNNSNNYNYSSNPLTTQSPAVPPNQPVSYAV